MNILMVAVAVLSIAWQGEVTLTREQLDRVERGEAVQVLQPTASDWPRSIVFQFIAAPPAECAAVLADYELQAAYIPRMKSSRILRRANGEADVEYVIDIPLYPDERSVSRQRVIAGAGEYRVMWKTLPDTQSRGSITTGSATFRPMVNSRTSRPGTLMIHDQSVIPASVFARVPFVRGKAIEASRDAAKAIRDQVERELQSDPARLKRQMTALQSMVTRGDSSRSPP